MDYAITRTLGLSYLDNRMQRCSVNGSLSRSCSLSCGVPQGNIFALQLLFLLYINDLPNCMPFKLSIKGVCRWYFCNLYAGFSVDNTQSFLNDDLANVSNWLIANKLTLNMTKTEFMLIVSKQRLYTLIVPPRPSINGAPIEELTTAKSLGLRVDDKLTWYLAFFLLGPTRK